MGKRMCTKLCRARKIIVSAWCILRSPDLSSTVIIYMGRDRCVSPSSSIIKAGFECIFFSLWMNDVCAVNKEPRKVYFVMCCSVLFLALMLVTSFSWRCFPVRNRTCVQTAGRANSASRQSGDTHWQHFPTFYVGAFPWPRVSSTAAWTASAGPQVCL